MDRSANEVENLLPYAGRWVACLGGRVVAQGGTPEQALQAAKASRFKESPQIIFVPTERPLIFSPLLDQVSRAFPREIPVYLVGGAVRDALLGRTTHDLDFALPRDALNIGRHVAKQIDAAFFPLDEERDTARLLLQQPDGQRVKIDISVFRGPNFESDLKGRDFTVNAMAIDIHQPQALLDPLGGLSDLRSKILRSCSSTSLADDPLRILLAIRIAAQYDFHIQKETRSQMRIAVPLLPSVSAERIRDELIRILEGRQPATCLRALDMLGVLPYTLPELVALKGIEQSSPHVLDVWNHTLAVVQKTESLLEVLHKEYDPDSAANLPLGLAVVRLGRYRQQISTHLDSAISNERSMRGFLILAALYHDIAKPQTLHTDEEGRVRFFGHEEIGAKIAMHRAQELRLSNPEVHRLGIIVRHHMRPKLLSQTKEPPSRSTIYRFFRDTGSAGIDVCLLSLADFLATYETTLDIDAWEAHLNVVRVLMEAWWENPKESVAPPTLLTGDDLIIQLGLKPGPQVGNLLSAIREAQATGQISSKAEAINLARKIMDNPSKVEF